MSNTPKATRDISIPIGSTVKITDSGQVYSHFQSMADLMGLTNFVDGEGPLSNGEGQLCVVVGKGIHYRESDGELLGLELQGGRQGLIGIRGVSLVSLPEDKDYDKLKAELVTVKAKLWEAEWKLRKITEVVEAGIA